MTRRDGERDDTLEPQWPSAMPRMSQGSPMLQAPVECLWQEHGFVRVEGAAVAAVPRVALGKRRALKIPAARCAD